MIRKLRTLQTVALTHEFLRAAKQAGWQKERSITVFSKGERSDLSKAECNGLRAITKAIVAEYS